MQWLFLLTQRYSSMALPWIFICKNLQSILFFIFDSIFSCNYFIRPTEQDQRQIKEVNGTVHLIISLQNSYKNSISSNYTYGDVISTFQDSQLELNYDKKQVDIMSSSDIKWEPLTRYWIGTFKFPGGSLKDHLQLLKLLFILKIQFFRKSLLLLSYRIKNYFFKVPSAGNMTA